MNTASTDFLQQRLAWRYATKEFDPTRQIPADQWTALLHSLVQAPSSFGLQPWKFIDVVDPAVRRKLRAVSWDQSQITDASHLVVLCRKDIVTPADAERFIKRSAAVRGVDPATMLGYQNLIVGFLNDPSAIPGGSMAAWTRSQVYIALGFFLAAAAMIGVDTCPLEGFDPEKYDEILGLSASGFSSTVVAAAGYRSAGDWLAPLPKVRYEAGEIVTRV